ncbi:hypothetical protein K490DRAFT_76478 [Saccharata proteae CBS 121410]|uniref:Mid2 domain-containing protein n=1 Tax=Saccharata proteae CBS 121410 TaxID=1314787 RepID=A0A9P4HQ25_9PEZI|nr:hypothetical protein K490DRAFT_76478 [Saccharata proteae CBS 121410]
MRFAQSPSWLSAAFVAALALRSPPSALANPIATQTDGLTELSPIDRGCSNPCGWSGQLCCEASEACYTDSNNQAQCGAATATTTGGYWQYYTSTWIETDTITYTSVYSSWYGVSAATATATGTITCDWSAGESSCGNICCASDQYCMLSGQCAAAAVTTSPGVAATGTGTGESYSAPLRPTTGTLIVVTATTSPTTTVPFETPVATGANVTVTRGEESSGGGLSGGAIAGIVIGTLLGIALLALLCLFCCLRAVFDGILALFGLGPKRRREEVVEERYTRHSGSGRHSDWYGRQPARPPPPPKKSGGLGGLGGVLAGLGGLAVVLGLKRKHDKRHADEKTDYTSSSYYYNNSDYTSTSSASSDDRRTRHTRHSSRR